ncbi:DUF6328 family protein [Longivirga aurantiaca]|uniref:DUF6328 family protein n=1 Tax=Longivirga aurantiaca TaxID=1837743 RepID=A0ABW1SYZ4_9ACTN
MDDARLDDHRRSTPTRDETEAERADRNYGEQLQEMRVAQTGVQLLLGFQLTIAFTQPFGSLSASQKDLYLVSIAASTVAMLCLMAPIVIHRFLFGRGQKPRLVRATHVLTLVGMVALAFAVTGSVTLAAWVAAGGSVAAWFAGITAGGALIMWLVLPTALRTGRRPTGTVR